ncbi:MAG: RimK family protein [Gammaproteobacteria bacterium]|nr:RimK family protein [Gammaproteobacteria bacterium]
MSEHIVIVESKKDWKENYPDLRVVLARDYLGQAEFLKKRQFKVVNLCRGSSYLSTGYYCSLLAEARNHNVIPTVRTMMDLNSKAIYSLNMEDFDEALQKSLSKLSEAKDTYVLNIIFGTCQEPILQELSRNIYDQFRSPLLRVELKQKGKWFISSIRSVHLNSLDEKLQAFFVQAFNAYLSKRWRSPKSKSYARYDIAILHNPEEKLPPSNKKALDKFIRTGKRMDINVELITKRDYSKLGEYDALFIRETTEIEHHTYRFAKKAESEGIPVIDSGDSILRCTNKVYLTELLTANNIPIPQTHIIQKGRVRYESYAPSLPLVVKIPDGAFSRGVFKAENVQQLKEICERLFKESDLLLAQEFLYTPYDWRIGILNRQPLYACQYFMSRKHWQIVKHKQDGKMDEGEARTWKIEEVPKAVIDIALKASNLIGDGLYGVDLKQTDKGVVVIEVNDNPNIDCGVEDKVIGDHLYEAILGELVQRIEQRGKRQLPSSAHNTKG